MLRISRWSWAAHLKEKPELEGEGGTNEITCVADGCWLFALMPAVPGLSYYKWAALTSCFHSSVIISAIIPPQIAQQLQNQFLSRISESLNLFNKGKMLYRKIKIVLLNSPSRYCWFALYFKVISSNILFQSGFNLTVFRVKYKEITEGFSL